MFASNTEQREENNVASSPATAIPGKAIELKSSSVMAVTAVLHTADLKLLDVCLRDAAGPDGDFFTNDITVIDLSELADESAKIDWPAIIKTFKSYRLNPVVVRNAPPDIEPAVLSCGLGIDVVGLARPKSVPETTLSAEPQPAPTATVKKAVSAPETKPVVSTANQQPVARPVETMIIDTPVRSGSRIYAPNADVVVTAVVNPGAEIIADGSIHVYAPLKGRALAGAKGNTKARIFALSMEAELVSIAGIYSTFEDGPDPELKMRPTQIRLVGNRLDIKPIDSKF